MLPIKCYPALTKKRLTHPQKKKLFVVFTSILAVMNSTISSGLASNSSPYFAREFGITSHELLVLPTSVFLIGYTVGPVVYGPMSEQYGRKMIMIYAFFFYTIFTMACALAPNFASLVVFRFLEGIGAACPIVVVGGLVVLTSSSFTLPMLTGFLE
jgi:MFS family permease